MKKFKFGLITLVILAIATLFPATHSVMAEDESPVSNAVYETILPDGIMDYVDLTGMKSFCFATTSQMYFVLTDTSDYKLYGYNFNNQQLTHLLTFSNEVHSVKFVNGYLLVHEKLKVKIYAVNTNETPVYVNDLYVSSVSGITNTINTPYDICFDGTNYYVASISNVYGQTENIIYITQFTDVTDYSDYTSKSISINYTIQQIAISNDYVFTYGNDEVIRNYIFTGDTIENNHTTSEFLKNEEFNLNSLDTLQFNGQSYYFLACDNNNLYLFDSGFNQIANKNDYGNPIILDSSNNVVYSYNQTHNNIQSSMLYVDEDDASIGLSASSVMLAGKGNSVGRFDGVNSIALKNDKYIFVSDYNNNRLQIINRANETQITAINNVYTPSNLILDNNNNLIYLSESQDGLKQNINGLSYSNGLYNNTLFNSIEVPKQVNSLCMDNSGKLYALNYATNEILVYTEYTSEPIITEITGATANLNSVIRYSEIDNMIYISVDNTIYRLLVNEDNSPASNYGVVDSIVSLSFTENVDTFEIDYSNNVFALVNNNIIKSALTSTPTFDTLDTKCTCSTFSLNPATGTIYAFNTGKSCLQTITDLQFSKGLSDFPHQYEIINSITCWENVLSYGTITQNSFIYSTVNFKGDFVYTGNSNIVALVLQEHITQATEFVRIGYIMNNKLEIGYVTPTQIAIEPTSYTVQEYKLRANNKDVSIYKYPTIASNIVSDTIDIGSVFTAVGIYNGCLEGQDSFYYIVKLGNRYGYVYNGDVTKSIVSSGKLETNATIRILDHSEFAYMYDTASDAEDVERIPLQNGQKIYVKDYDKNHAYTLVSFIDSEHNQHEGYVKTQYIKMDGLSSGFVVTIIMFCISILLLVAVIAFYITYKKKQPQNDEDDAKLMSGDSLKNKSNRNRKTNNSNK